MYYARNYLYRRSIMKRIFALVVMLMGVNSFANANKQEITLEINDENSEKFSTEHSGLKYVISAEQLNILVEDGVISSKKSGSSTDCGGGGEWGK